VGVYKAREGGGKAGGDDTRRERIYERVTIDRHKDTEYRPAMHRSACNYQGGWSNDTGGWQDVRKDHPRHAQRQQFKQS